MIRCKTTARHYVALVFAASALVPFAVSSQSLIDPFDVGGGLLLETADPLVTGPGVISAPAQGGAGGAGGPVNGQTLQQNQPGGARFTLDFSTGFEHSESDTDATESFLEDRFDFGVLSETRDQRFELSVGLAVRLQELDSGITDPSASLSYGRFNRSTEFGIDLTWRESDVNSGFLPADFDAEDLIRDTGTQEIHAARIDLETGRDRRFGTVISLGYRQLDYVDADPSLTDELTYDALTELRFSFDRVEVTALAGWSERSEEDANQTQDTDTRYELAAEILLDQAWTADVSLAFVEEELATTADVTQQDGVDFSASLTRFMPNGTLVFSASYLGIDGVTGLEATRALSLANGAALSASVGVVAFDGGDVLPDLGLNYRHEILRGRSVVLSLTQSGGQDDDGDALYRTALNGTYEHELTRNSQLQVTGALATLQPQDGSADTLAASLGLAYSHDLTRDWALVARADTRLNFENGTRTDRNDTFSIRLERSFSWRP